MAMTTMLVAAAAVLVILLGMTMMVMKFYRKVEQGKALIVNTMRSEPEVTFTGKVVIPIIHKAEVMDISVKTIEIDRRGKEGLICQDNIRADVKVVFFVRVNKTREDVIRVAQAIGCNRASDQRTLEELFSAKFSEALKTVGKQLDFVDLYTQRDNFRDQIIQIIGRDLNGYALEDAAIDYLEQTPLDSLDSKNILDAEGIRKITELTAIQHVHTNNFRNEEMKKIKKQDVEAREAILELERQQAVAEAKQMREIETVQARETAEAAKVSQEERLKAESARIRSDEELAIADENCKREVAVAAKNRERIVAVEEERVIKARDLEIVERQRETELRTIDKDKAIEVEKREIANVVRERVMVDKTVAEQEEAILTLRTVEEAGRAREQVVIAADAEAEEAKIKQVKSAEAAEIAARSKAKEEVTLADAQLQAAEREAQAKIRLADGQRAQSAAEGLAKVQVEEAEAIAVEKMGIAQARVKEADAVATEKMGQAQATAAREQLFAEAAGLAEKASSMNTLTDHTRAHEEFRLQVDKDRILGLEAIGASIKIAEEQAEIIAEGLKQAKIDIVGGESVFFDRLVSAISSGKSVDAFVNKSVVTSSAMSDYFSGDASIREDLKDILSDPSVSSGDVANLTVAALLSRLMSGAGEDQRAKVSQLLAAAQRLGVDGMPLK